MEGGEDEAGTEGREILISVYYGRKIVSEKGKDTCQRYITTLTQANLLERP